MQLLLEWRKVLQRSYSRGGDTGDCKSDWVPELLPRGVPAQISWYKLYVGIGRQKGVLLLVLFGVWRSIFWSALTHPKAYTMATTTMLLLLLLHLLPTSTNAEHRRFDGPINAASNYIHYSEGYVVTPGYVDISDLVFEAVGEAGNGEMMMDYYDDGVGYDDDDGVMEYGDDDGGDGDDERRRLDDNGGVETYVDIVLFHEPSKCANTRFGCDWTELGIGASDTTGNLRWCCSDDASALGLCTGGPSQEGRLIVDPTKFRGQHKFLAVPPQGEWRRNVQDGLFVLDNKEESSGKYVMVVANCNESNGRDLTVSGEYTWSSVHGYLPGNLFGEMYFFMVLFVCYLVVFTVYGCKMNTYREAIIPIQKWMLATIGIGLLE
eukprot:scaffold31982_cov23-Cyclotella_meneghiniana.AAC.2